jgi:hypothetical protein
MQTRVEVDPPNKIISDGPRTLPDGNRGQLTDDAALLKKAVYNVTMSPDAGNANPIYLQDTDSGVDVYPIPATGISIEIGIIENIYVKGTAGDKLWWFASGRGK